MASVYRNVRLWFLALTVVLLSVKCNQSQENVAVSSLSGFDVSPKGNYIVFSIKKNGKASLYRSNIDGKNPKLLFSSDKNLSFYNPRFSNDGEKIVFIGKALKGVKSSLWIGKIDGGGLTQATDSIGLRVEAIFSQNDAVVYFTQANEFAGYSPLARKAAHNFDIYTVNLGDRKVNKISNLKAYALYNISDFDEDNILLSMRGGNGGIFLYKKKTGNDLQKIVTTNDTLRNSTGYANPVIIDGDNIICSSYYQLVNINTLTKKEKWLLPSTGSQFSEIRYCKKMKRVFFKKNDDTDDIYSINLDGSDLKEISLAVK